MLLFSYKYIDSGDFLDEEDDKRSDRSWMIQIYENGKVFYKCDEKNIPPILARQMPRK